MYDFGARTMTYSSDDSTLLQVLGSPPQQWLDAEKRGGGCWMEAVGPGYAATRLRGYAATLVVALKGGSIGIVGISLFHTFHTLFW